MEWWRGGGVEGWEGGEFEGENKRGEGGRVGWGDMYTPTSLLPHSRQHYHTVEFILQQSVGTGAL